MTEIVASLLIFLLVPTASYPIRVGCDFRVIPVEVSAGLNVMTTTENIMGAPPVDRNDLASVSTDQFSAGSIVTISFVNTFGMGLAHATSGTFTAPQFSAVAADGAVQCLGMQTIVYKNTADETNSITWVAPSDVNALSTVTISFASAAGFTPISRQSITLTRSGTSGIGQTAGQYITISSGTCASNGMDMITDTTSCGTAAEVLGLSVISAGAFPTSETPLPEACFYDGDRVYLAVNQANAGNGANPPYQLICLTRAAEASTVVGEDNKVAIMIGGSIGAILLFCLCVFCIVRRTKRRETFEV